MTAKVTILMSFNNGRTEEVDIKEGGWWRYTEPHQGPERLVIKPDPDKEERHEMPLINLIGIRVTCHPQRKRLWLS